MQNEPSKPSESSCCKQVKTSQTAPVEMAETPSVKTEEKPIRSEATAANKKPSCCG